MKICENCGAQLSDDAAFCTQCGKAMFTQQYTPNQSDNSQYNSQGSQQYNQYGQYNQEQRGQYQQQYYRPNPYDHTAEFDQEDIHKNKIYAMLVYLCGLLGIIVALLASGREESKYISFHIRQGIKLIIVEAILAVITIILSWTVVFLVAGIICICICLVLDIIAFIWVCMGKAKEVPIIRAFPFLK